MNTNTAVVLIVLIIFGTMAAESYFDKEYDCPDTIEQVSERY